MAEREKYYYTFRFVDGAEQEFEDDNDRLISKVLNTGNTRIEVGNVIINLDNVIKVTVETDTQRKEKQRLKDEKYKENIKAISELGF